MGTGYSAVHRLLSIAKLSMHGLSLKAPHIIAAMAVEVSDLWPVRQ